MDINEGLEPMVFFRTIRARELMLLRNRPVSGAALGRCLHRIISEMRDDLDALVAAGLALGREGKYELTEEGQASVRWSAPPPPGGVIKTPWVGRLARAIADYYEVSMADMLRMQIGHCVVARSRLCFALWARGWAFERIEEHFGLPSSWARRAVERWKRMRDELPPRSGAELRVWRESHGLTMAQAAVRLGVSRMTVMRWEKRGEFNSRMYALRT